VPAAVGSGPPQLDALMPPPSSDAARREPDGARLSDPAVREHDPGSVDAGGARDRPGPAAQHAREARERYEIVAELGRGGMASSTRRWTGTRPVVALKILPWQLRSDETAMRYFIRERRRSRAPPSEHRRPLRLWRRFGSLYLAMEYLEGPNLQK